VAPSETGEPIPWPIPDSLRRPSIVPRDDSAAVVQSERERLLPMMGPGQTLSAGIAIGHYKTSLGELVRASWEERERAKGKLENEDGVGSSTRGNAFSIRRYTRGGEKTRLSFAWGKAGESPDEALKGYERVRHVIDAFKNGHLPGRLPYTLREVEEAVLAVWLEGTSGLLELGKTDSDSMANKYADRVASTKSFARGIFDTRTEGDGDAFAIWWHGLAEALDIVDARSRHLTRDAFESSTNEIKASLERMEARRQGARATFARGLGSEQGLAVCRSLGALFKGEGDAR
jgi:hypothetical protein